VRGPNWHNLFIRNRIMPIYTYVSISCNGICIHIDIYVYTSIYVYIYIYICIESLEIWWCLNICMSLCVEEKKRESERLRKFVCISFVREWESVCVALLTVYRAFLIECRLQSIHTRCEWTKKIQARHTWQSSQLLDPAIYKHLHMYICIYAYKKFHSQICIDT